MADVKLRWTLPTERADHKALALSEIAFVRLELSVNGTDFGKIVDVTIDPADPKLDYTQTELESGTWHFRGTVFDKFGQAGAPKTATVVILPAPPGELQTFVADLV